jgi:hypothetical protein
MDKIYAFYQRYSVRGSVATILVLWGIIHGIRELVGLVDQIRSMMDPNHWFTQVIFWPQLSLVIGGIGVVLLLFLIAKETPSEKVETQASAPVAAAPQNGECCYRIKSLYENGKRLVKEEDSPGLHKFLEARYDYIQTFPNERRFAGLDDWGPEVKKVLQECCTKKQVFLFTSAESTMTAKLKALRDIIRDY